MQLQIKAWGRRVELTFLSVILLMVMSALVYFIFPSVNPTLQFLFRILLHSRLYQHQPLKISFFFVAISDFFKRIDQFVSVAVQERWSRSSEDILEQQALLSSLPTLN